MNALDRGFLRELRSTRRGWTGSSRTCARSSTGQSTERTQEPGAPAPGIPGYIAMVSKTWTSPPSEMIGHPFAIDAAAERLSAWTIV
jgi:hypothetical protein